ncbi:MAG: glycosyltransferase [Gemmatimonadetes bacterium]|nr:glycosyltransferase [Gemmatimonadota bacterium]
MLDEYSFAETEQPLNPMEIEMIRRVDDVFLHSEGLLERKGKFNPRTHVVPNGVEYELFSRARPQPADLAAIPHPRIGYTGWIKKQLDWSLLESLATRNPQWHFVFVGGRSPHAELDDVVERLQSLPNVHFLGEKPTTELAAYPQHFDCCIMPYEQNAYTNSIYPLKLHEYLATGRPVVGSRIRSLELHEEVVSLAGTAEQWETGIRGALRPEASTADLIQKRKAIAQQHDWSVLVRKIADRIGVA